MKSKINVFLLILFSFGLFDVSRTFGIGPQELPGFVKIKSALTNKYLVADEDGK